MNTARINEKHLISVLTKVGTVKKYTKGEYIYRQMEKPSCFYYIRKGKVRNFIITEDGKEKTCTITIDSEFFGVTAFFDDDLCDTTAQTMEDSEIFSIDKKGMQYISQNEPDIVALIMKSMAHKIRLLSLQMTTLAFLSADKKIAQMLIHMAERYSLPENESQKVTINCSHEDIAVLSSTARTTVTQELRRFEQMGLVSTGYRSITVNDISALKDYLNG